MTLTDIKTLKREANKVDMEFVLYNQAVPDDEVSALFHHNKSYNTTNEAGETQRIHEQSYRRVMRFVKGLEFNHFCRERVHYTHELLQLFLKAAEQLQVIHQHGVVHGDISSRNMLANEVCHDYVVTFVDFWPWLFS